LGLEECPAPSHLLRDIKPAEVTGRENYIDFGITG
jgi:hypothetical protein